MNTLSRLSRTAGQQRRRPSILRIFVAPELACFLHEAEEGESCAGLPAGEREWVLVWMQQILIYLAAKGDEGQFVSLVRGALRATAS